MAKSSVVVIEETNLPALFYFRHLLEERVGAPVYYYDEIDKRGIDVKYENIKDIGLKENIDQHINDVESVLAEVNKTCYHGFKYTTIHENVPDEGLSRKHAQKITKMIKNHEAPYDDVFKKYSVHVYSA